MTDKEQLKQKILIVDDMPSNIKILGTELQEDYDIYIANNGEKAIKVAEDILPDLILLDIMMPGIDGYEICNRLKNNSAVHKIPVIFITAKNTEEDEILGLSVGAVDYITKPFRLPIVRARIKTHLELKRKSDLLENISSRDGLTGIFNRRQFDLVIETEWNRAIRHARQLSVILLDLDYFKLYNDNYGHLAGDECLKTVAEALSANLKRATDFVARYGGEEFVIVLPETPPEEAFFIGEKLRKVIEGLKIEHKYSAVSNYITISAGAATTVPTSSVEYLVLPEAADKALYEAKQAGRNNVKVKNITD